MNFPDSHNFFTVFVFRIMSTWSTLIRHFRQNPGAVMGVLSYLSTEIVLFCNLLQNPAQLVLWNPIMVMRKRLRAPQARPNPHFQPHRSPTGSHLGAFSCFWVSFRPQSGRIGLLPKFTIFPLLSRHSFSIFMIDLRFGLRYNISIKSCSFQPIHPYFGETGGYYYESQCQTRVYGPHHQF